MPGPPPGGPATPPAPPVPPPPGTPGAQALTGSAAGTVALLEASVAGLADLDTLPVGEHVARYDALHGELSEALAAIDGV
ncbi:MAG TPA: hypothetical protein VI357_08355 [Mycobacteriales bacterium]